MAMTHLLKAAMIGVFLAGTAIATPSAANQVAVTVAPQNPRVSNALGTSLRLYSAYNNFRSGAIRQRGRDNRAGLTQNGRGHNGLVQQRGDRHEGTLRQEGERNAYGLFQFGRGARDDVVQTGRGNSGVTFSYGW